MRMVDSPLTKFLWATIPIIPNCMVFITVARAYEACRRMNAIIGKRMNELSSGENTLEAIKIMLLLFVLGEICRVVFILSNRARRCVFLALWEMNAHAFLQCALFILSLFFLEYYGWGSSGAVYEYGK